MKQPDDVALVGREEELSFLASALARGGCLIAGAAGVGKSRLAIHAATLHGAPHLRVVATAAASAIPFGAFGHLLSRVKSDRGNPIPAFIEMLRRLSPGERPTLLLDDAHLLDPASAALVLAVGESEAASTLATARHGQRMPDAITSLWKEEWLERLDLQPLSRRETRALVEAHLGAPAEVDVHSEIFALTEGNPLYTRELLIDTVRSGALAESAGRWAWTGTPPQMARLGDLIAARTGELSEAGSLALELLAVGAPLHLTELVAASSGEAVAELERAGVAAVHGPPESQTVELAHPLFGEVTLSALPAATARAHRRRLAAALEAAAPAEGLDLLRLAVLKLESGETDAELFRRAGAYALRVETGVPGPGWDDGDPTVAIRLADAAGDSIEAALLAGRGLMALSRFDEVEGRFRPLQSHVATAAFEYAEEYLRTRVHALHWSGRTGDALELLADAEHWRAEADWRVIWATLNGWILHDLGQHRSVVDALDKSSLPHRDEAAPHVRLDALLLLAMAYSRLGLTDDSEGLSPQITGLVAELEARGWQTGWARYVVDAIAYVEAARDVRGVAARLSQARDRAEASENPALAAGLAMVLGRLELVRGHVRDAIAHLEDAVHGLTTGDPRNGLGWALAHLTRAHALNNDIGTARSTLAQGESVAAERPSHFRMHEELSRARAWIEAAEGHLPAARTRLIAIADAAGEALAAEAEAIYDALRFGASPQECARRLTQLAERADSDLIGACAQHAAALAAGDAVGELASAENFAALGLDLPAAEAAAGALHAFAGEGRESSARRAGALMAKHTALCQGATTPALLQRPDGPALTPREREIAMLAARGQTNAQIAAELVLSVRTVETYVLRVCHKLGVDRRTELAAVLSVDSG